MSQIKSIRKIKSDIEKQIITGLIIDDNFCSELLQITKPEYFKLKYAKTILRWLDNYYEEYQKAPKQDIQTIYDVEQEYLDPSDKKIIKTFLSNISKDYEVVNYNSQYQIQVARDYFNKRNEQIFFEMGNKLITAGKVKEAEELHENYHKASIEISDRFNPFDDHEINIHGVEKKGNRLFKFNGAIGNLFGHFERGWLVAVTGAEKKGKCESKDTNILLADGRIMTIEDVVKNKESEIICLDESTLKLKKGIVKDWIVQPIQKVYEVKTKTGRKIKITKNHPLLSSRGWNELKDLNVGDYIASAKKTPFFGKNSLPKHELKLLAYLITEGCLRGDVPAFTKHEAEMMNDFKICVRDIGDNATHNKKKNITYATNNKKLIGKHNKNNTKKLLKKHDLMGVLSKNKKMPDAIFELPKNDLSLFLNILFSCDGSIYKTGIEYSSSSEHLAYSVFHLLSRFGVVSKLYFSPNDFAGCWTVVIKDAENIKLFCSEIGFSFKKENKMKKILDYIKDKKHKSFLDKIPSEIGKQIRKEYAQFCKENNLSTKTFGKRWKSINYQLNKGCPIMKTSYLDNKNHPIIKKYLNSDILWDKIVSIDEIGMEQTYDLEIEENHNFVAEGIVTHNSWWLQEIVFQALMSKLKVLWINLEMNKVQVKERFYQRFTGMDESLINEIIFPVFDCFNNQDGSCMKKKRTNKINNLLDDINDDEDSIILPEFRDHPKYKVCTECRGTNDFILRYWFQKQKNIKARTNSATRKKRDHFKMMFSTNLRIKIFPAFSAKSIDIKKEINDLKRSEGFIPDIIVNDYIDIQDSDNQGIEGRDKINKIWQQAKNIAATMHCCYFTADQADAAAREQRSLKQKNFSDDKRKDGHLDMRIGLNQTIEEKEHQIMRLNILYHRHRIFLTNKEVMALQALRVGQTLLDSELI